jgi:hypothetical protein
VASIASILAYFFMINVTHPQADEFYLENMYLAIPLLIALPLSSVYKLNEKQVVHKQLSGFLVCICLICIGRLWFVSGQYTERMNWFRTTMKKFEGQKTIISENDAPMKQLLFSWPSAYECWMLSTIETGHTSSLVVVDDLQKLIPYKDTTSAFIGIQIYRYQDLPSRYFKFNDTLTSYRIIE